jgi:hypothetical protein
MADINKGQTCSNTSPTPTPSASSNNTTVTPTPTPAVTKPTMITYKDPQGRFSIYHPANWTVTPAANRFQDVLVMFSNCCQKNGIYFSDFDVALVRINGATTTTDPSAVANLYSDNPANIPPGDSMFQNTECTKYHTDGQKACSIIFTFTNPANQAGVIEEVISYVHGIMFEFNMASSTDNFDSYLPTFQKMIASFRSPP